jgi:uncharacterized protein YecE (DUF72 family)
MAKLHLGLSGFDYKEWQGEGLFYPPTIKRAGYLEHYGSRLNSLELNGTHQSVPTEASIERWINATPTEFSFSPKMHQRVSHFTRLKPEGLDTLKLFVERLEPMEKAGKLGPILVQLPPNFKRDDERLSSFLKEIPHRSTLRWAMEFRSDSWHASEVEDVLRSHGVAWVAAETDDEAAQFRSTSDFVFARLRRIEYTDDQLKEWAEFFRGQIANGKDCFAYCRHKDTVAPWKWADRLRQLVG